MDLQIARDTLIGDRVRPKGEVIKAEGKYAEMLVRTGAAAPVAGTPALETTSAEPRAERAVSPRQRQS